MVGRAADCCSLRRVDHLLAGVVLVFGVVANSISHVPPRGEVAAPSLCHAGVVDVVMMGRCSGAHHARASLAGRPRLCCSPDSVEPADCVSVHVSGVWCSTRARHVDL